MVAAHIAIVDDHLPLVAVSDRAGIWAETLLDFNSPYDEDVPHSHCLAIQSRSVMVAI